MAVVKSTVLFVFLLTVVIHFAVLCGIIHVGTAFEGASTAVALHDSENDIDDDADGVVVVDDQDNLEIFEPTKEWKTVQEGQAIPAGLHVRINLATGLKEAKLLDTEEEVTGADWQRESNSLENAHIMEDLKMRLSKVKGEEVCEEDGEQNDEALMEEAKTRYRSIDQIKKEFAELNLIMETDQEIMARLVKQYGENTSIDARKLILEDLEYYVHQVDNAVDLERLGGWDVIISAMNGTDEEICIAAAHVLGSAVQSNPKAQIIAIERGALHILLHLLALSPSTAVQRRALYGLSSLIRFFPFAQQKFLDLGGLGILSSRMRDNDADRFVLKIKSVTLLHDLLIEQRDSLSEYGDDDVSRERRSQYAKINLAPQMVEQGWCEYVPTMLAAPDHDTREKVLLMLGALISHCKQYHSNSWIKSSLESMSQDYHSLAAEEALEGESDAYFSGLSILVDQLLNTINS